MHVIKEKLKFLNLIVKQFLRSKTWGEWNSNVSSFFFFEFEKKKGLASVFFFQNRNMVDNFFLYNMAFFVFSHHQYFKIKFKKKKKKKKKES